MKRGFGKSLIVGLVLAIAAAAASASSAASSDRNSYRWLDARGEPLPFKDDGELLEFLTTARVVSEKDIGVGINRSKKLLLDKDSIQAHAIFREADERTSNALIEGVSYLFFADSYIFEPAAYHLAKMLDIHSIPPAAVRFVGRRQGSIQIWVEDSIDEGGADFRPPNVMAWVQQTWDRFFFDNLVYNIDRNPGNLLVTQDYRQWMIDHTRAFQFKNEFLDDRILKIRRSSWERLTKLTEKELRDAMRGYLTTRETGSLLKRRAIIIDHIKKFLDERGEEAVLYPMN